LEIPASSLFPLTLSETKEKRMATMIPGDIEQFTTPGEGQVYNFLAAVAKPDAEYTVWYSPDIKGREPDFVLFHDEIGLVIFEVKDWALGQILEADKKQFRLFMNGQEVTRKNPMQQAREYFRACMDALKKDGHLLSAAHGHGSNPKVPVSCGVIFPNINKMEFEEKALQTIVEEDKVFFWDDLHPESFVSRDTTGKTFHDILLEKFAPRFPCQLTGKEKVHLKQIIFPVVRIEQPRNAEAAEFSALENRISSLDHHQEALARKFDGGHRILKGPSGCGKTLVLVHKALFLLRYNPAVTSVLFVCFNVTLVRYIKRLLAGKQVPMGEKGVDVVHFYELCNRINGESVDYEGQDQDYYQIVLDDAVQASENYRKYDAVLVDEGQDFSDEMFKVIMNLLNPKTDILTIALDENQNIYSRTRNWKALGIHARGRTHTIQYIYRSTRELTEFAARLAAGGGGDPEERQSVQTELFPGYFDFHGPGPAIEKYATQGDLLEHVAEEISRLVIDKQYPLSEIAVLYSKSKLTDQDGGSLPEKITSALDRKGMLYNWVSEDYRAKKSYDITTDSVTISTIHSVKGFDYAAVFVLGLDALDQNRWSREQADRLTYVAITRARFRLYIPYLTENRVVQNLLECR
jgi:hypothetical protein